MAVKNNGKTEGQKKRGKGDLRTLKWVREWRRTESDIPLSLGEPRKGERRDVSERHGVVLESVFAGDLYFEGWMAA